jgi:hypothetical protein
MISAFVSTTVTVTGEKLFFKIQFITPFAILSAFSQERNSSGSIN